MACFLIRLLSAQVTGTRRWLRRLGLPVVKSWRPWRSATGQVGGYYERYQGLTFVTVRDAGHMVRAHHHLLCCTSCE
jgi:serine carboxypeptidase-like clade 2